VEVETQNIPSSLRPSVACIILILVVKDHLRILKELGLLVEVVLRLDERLKEEVGEEESSSSSCEDSLASWGS